MVRIQIRTDRMSVLIWVQTACKGYQQTIKSRLARKELNNFEAGPGVKNMSMGGKMGDADK